MEAHWSFLLIALFFGGALVALTPPLWGTDEGSHFFRAYQISVGQFDQSTTIKNGHTYGNRIPASFRDLNTLKTNDIKSTPYKQNHQVDDSQKYSLIGSRTPSTEQSVQSPYGPIIYPIFAYTAPSSVMYIESFFHPSTATLLYSARFATLIFYILVVTLALYIMRTNSAKWILFLIALLPTSLYSASIVNADSVLLASTLLFIACAYTLTQSKMAEKWKITLLTLSAILITSVKPPYLVLILPLALLPLGAKVGEVEKRIIRWTIPILCLIIAGISIISLESTITGGSTSIPGVSASGQLQWILHHPLGYLSMLINSTIIMDWLPQVIGIFGSSFILMPGPIRQILLIWLTLSIFLSISNKESKTEVMKKVGFTYIFAALLAFIAVVSALYLTWTPVGSSLVQGVQGRYFIPILAFVMIGVRLIFKQRLVVEKEWKLNVLNVGIVTVCLLGSVLFYYRTLYH